MESKKIKICPRCGKEYTDYPAISRCDNKTEICSECGLAEALEDLAKLGFTPYSTNAK